MRFADALANLALGGFFALRPSLGLDVVVVALLGAAYFFLLSLVQPSSPILRSSRFICTSVRLMRFDRTVPRLLIWEVPVACSRANVLAALGGHPVPPALMFSRMSLMSFRELAQHGLGVVEALLYASIASLTPSHFELPGNTHEYTSARAHRAQIEGMPARRISMYFGKVSLSCGQSSPNTWRRAASTKGIKAPLLPGPYSGQSSPLIPCST